MIKIVSDLQQVNGYKKIISSGPLVSSTNKTDRHDITEIARRNTQNELVVAQEKSDFVFNFNCFSQRKAGKVYIFISEGNSILDFKNMSPNI